MRRYKKILIGIGIFLAVFGITGFFILPPIVKSTLVEKLSETLRRPVSIEEIKINPYRFTATIRGFEIKEPSGSEKFVAFEELYVNVDTFSIFRRALILKEIRLTKPFFRIIRNPDASYNFSDLLVKPAEGKTDQEKKFLFSLNNIRIAEGSVDFLDGPKQTKHTVRDLLIALPFISNMDYRLKEYTQPEISATINGNAYSIKGKSMPFSDSRETSLDIDIKDLNIPYYLAYVPMDLNFKILSGTLDTNLRLSFAQASGKQPTVSLKGDVTLKQFVLEDKKARPLFKVPTVAVSVANIEPLTSVYHFSKVAILSPEVSVRRGKDGKWNLLSLLPEKKKEDKKSVREEPQKTAEKDKPPMLVNVDALQIEEGKITLRDEQPSDAVSLALNKVNLKVNYFSTKKDGKAALDLSADVDKKGSIATTGSLVIDPLSADLAVKLNDIDIRAFQGYFTDKVKIAVTGGRITASGDVSVRHQGEKGLSAKYNGKLLIAGFSSIDKQNADDFLKWKSLFFSDVRIGYNPLSLDIRQIALADFYARFIINEDGTLNLQNILEEKKPPDAAVKAADGKPPEEETAKASLKADASGKVPAKPIKIGAITVQGGTVVFLDRHIKPNYSANLSQLGGRISGLTSIGEKPADLELRGKFEHHMPLEITGRVHPLREDLFVDLKATFRDVDLSPVSPYSGKFIGYTIQKGKLSFDLKYLITQKKLDSENKVFIDQLTLGDRVESPQATKLPVGLAIALLKDRKGEINLDIPVTGSLDDPKFSLGRLIIQVIVNLITKAVTAPFALLGSLFGGGEELSYIEFDYGHTTLTDTGLKKIQTLTKALYERPALKLDIEGHADLERDREGFKKYMIERKMKARKLNDMVKGGSPTVPVEEVRIEAPEREKYLTQVYRSESFPKPRNMIGLVKTLPAVEMEKLLMTYAVVKEEDIKLLAAQRASVVRDLILKSGQVPPERVFVVEPKSLAAEKKEKVKNSRVDFKLK